MTTSIHDAWLSIRQRLIDFGIPGSSAGPLAESLHSRGFASRELEVVLDACETKSINGVRAYRADDVAAALWKAQPRRPIEIPLSMDYQRERRVIFAREREVAKELLSHPDLDESNPGHAQLAEEARFVMAGGEREPR